MFFRAADAVLVFADGREVADVGGHMEWRSDVARKFDVVVGPARVIAAGLRPWALWTANMTYQEPQRRFVDGLVLGAARRTCSYAVRSGDEW